MTPSFRNASHVTGHHSAQVGGWCVPALKYCVVKVVLKGLAVRNLLQLLLQLVVCLGAGAAAPPGGRLVGVVPLLLVLAVQVGRLSGRKLHACERCWDEVGGVLERHRRGGVVRGGGVAARSGRVAPSIQTL